MTAIDNSLIRLERTQSLSEQTKIDTAMSGPSKPSSSRSSATSEQTRSDSKGSSQGPEPRKSAMGEVIDKAKTKLSRRPSDSEALPESEEDFQKQKAKDVKKEKRMADYERLGLAEKTRYGTAGAGGWSG